MPGRPRSSSATSGGWLLAMSSACRPSPATIASYPSRRKRSARAVAAAVSSSATSTRNVRVGFVARPAALAIARSDNVAWLLAMSGRGHLFREFARRHAVHAFAAKAVPKPLVDSLLVGCLLFPDRFFLRFGQLTDAKIADGPGGLPSAKSERAARPALQADGNPPVGCFEIDHFLVVDP